MYERKLEQADKFKITTGIAASAQDRRYPREVEFQPRRPADLLMRLSSESCKLRGKALRSVFHDRDAPDELTLPVTRWRNGALEMSRFQLDQN
jgi:hypothetical protein